MKVVNILNVSGLINCVFDENETFVENYEIDFETIDSNVLLDFIRDIFKRDILNFEYDVLSKSGFFVYNEYDGEKTFDCKFHLCKGLLIDGEYFMLNRIDIVN